MLRQDVLDAIDDEIKVTAQPVRARMAKVQIVGKLVELYLKDDMEGLDESIEEAMAWWGPGQQASVLAIHLEEHKVTLRHVVGAPPSADTLVSFHKPKYLKKLYAIWQHPRRSAEALNVLTALKTPQVRFPVCRSSLFPELREKQQEALGLKNQHIGFL